jgi:WhiB family redox-sensing transcriptional regulator
MEERAYEAADEHAGEPAEVSHLEREIRERALTAWLMAPNEPEVVQGIAYLLFRRPKWQLQAACRGADTALFLSGRGRNASTAAIAVCAACFVRDECLDYAMSDIEIVGVWGGTTTEERRRLRRNA